MPYLTPPTNKRHLRRSSSPLGSTSGYILSTSVSSSQDTVEPVTPLEADGEFIDQLWEQVRSRSKGPSDVAIRAEEKKVQENTTAEQRVTKRSKSTAPRLSKQASLTFRDSSNGKNTFAILNLPGVLKPDVHISYQHKRLIVSYKSVEETENWEPDKVVQEVKERRCVRSIALPESVRPEHVRASMPDHRLFISYPKC